MSLIRSAFTVGGFTLISRILGFIRDQLIAFTLGTGPVAEAFFVAQRLPNMFRALFAEGAFNAAFVPQFARKLEGEGRLEASIFAREMFSVLLTWLLLFTALAEIFMPWALLLIAPGFSQNPATYDLAVTLTRICFPYLLFMSLTALQSGLLNSLNRFTAAAVAPILLNIVMIGSNIVASVFHTGNSATTGYIFAWGVTIAGVAQYCLLAVACRRAGFSLVPSLPRLTPAVKRVLALSVPGLISGGVGQINLLVSTILATGFPHAVAYLYYADRVYQLPLGVIGVAIGVVLLPDLSRKLRAGDAAGASASMNRALELSLFLTIPAAIALMAIPVPILHTVFEHGQFSAQDTWAVAPALLAFSSGLPAYALGKVFQPGFYAREDTKTPMRFALISMAVNVAGSLMLAPYFQHVGIAMATSIAAWVNAFLLGLTLHKRGYLMADARLKRRLAGIIISALTMGGGLLGLAWLLAPHFMRSASFFTSLWSLCLLVFGGIALYFGCAQLSGAMSWAELKKLRRR